MKSIQFAILSGLLALSLPLQAQDFPTVFPALRNENPREFDALTGRCSSEDGGQTIDCLFITVIVNRAQSEDGVTCRLWGTAGTETLTRVEPAKWAIETEPSGLCGVYNRVEFSCEPESMFQCEYFEQSTYTITTGEACAHYSDTPDPGDRYSWRATEPLDVSCDRIEFDYN